MNTGHVSRLVATQKFGAVRQRCEDMTVIRFDRVLRACIFEMTQRIVQLFTVRDNEHIRQGKRHETKLVRKSWLRLTNNFLE